MQTARVGRRQVWKGVLGAVALGWLSLGCLSGVSFSVMGWLSPRGDTPVWAWAIFALWWLTGLPLISFVAGLIGAWFWHPIATKDDCARWGIWTLFGALLPTFFGLSCCVMVLGFWPCLWVFDRGLDYGYQWWPQREWRAFFGLTNKESPQQATGYFKESVTFPERFVKSGGFFFPQSKLLLMQLAIGIGGALLAHIMAHGLFVALGTHTRHEVTS